jgi:hypothetical protein
MSRIVFRKILKIVWFTASIYILYDMLYQYHTTKNNEVIINNMMSMVVLSMPLGIVVSFFLNILLMIIYKTTLYSIPNNWLLAVSCG